MSLYHRLGHMKEAPIVSTGNWVERGQLIGTIGTTGSSSGPHLHYDIFNTKDYGWTFYVYGWSLAKLLKIFVDPTRYIKCGIPSDWTQPKIGYTFLQKVYDIKNGNYFHPGIDVNGVNDYGKDVRSPVAGRVVYVQAPKDKIWSKIWGWLVWGKGWGNMVVIEQGPGFDVNHI